MLRRRPAAPDTRDRGAGETRPRGSGPLASLLVAVGAALALLTVGLGSALAVVFGLGWGVLIVAAALLATGLTWLRDTNPGLVLLPVAALVLPASLVLATREQLPRTVGSNVLAPSAALPGRTLASSTGTLFVDLRHFAFRDAGVSTLHVDGGVGRTIVALPIDRCVAVRIRYVVHSGLLHAAARAAGIAADTDPAISVFGDAVAAGRGEVSRWIARGRPVLDVDYRSQGGALYVRDYPGGLDPRGFDDWPGVLVPGLVKPSPRGETHAEFTLALADWRSQRAQNRRVARLGPGPCRSAR